MLPKVKIVHQDSKWTKVKYTSSNAITRIKTEQLKEDYANGIIDLTNPDLLEN